MSRKHVCPVCQAPVVGGEAALIRNFLVDELTQTVRKAVEETDVAYMRLLFTTASSEVSKCVFYMKRLDDADIDQ